MLLDGIRRGDEEEPDDPLAFRLLDRVPVLGGPLQGLQWPHVHLQEAYILIRILRK